LFLYQFLNLYFSKNFKEKVWNLYFFVLLFQINNQMNKYKSTSPPPSRSLFRVFEDLNLSLTMILLDEPTNYCSKNFCFFAFSPVGIHYTIFHKNFFFSSLSFFFNLFLNLKKLVKIWSFLETIFFFVKMLLFCVQYTK
jgi:hypothetical protein